MRKVIVILMICGILFVCGCNKNNELSEPTSSGVTKNNDEIIVTCSSWSGWSSEYEPVDETYIYSAREGQVISLTYKGMVEKLKFEIMSVSPKSVTIKTNQCMSCSEVGESGINLNSKETVFEIKKGEKIELTTLTMDAGDVYTIEY